MTFDDPYDDHAIKFRYALDTDPRMPLGSLIIHQNNLVAGADHLSGLIFVWPFLATPENDIQVDKMRILQGHQANITALIDLSDRFASCSKDGTVRIWQNFNCIHILQKCHSIEKYPTSLASYYRPDQNLPLLFSGGTDGLIVAYDIKLGRASNVTGGHSGWILCLTCKTDGPFLFSGSTDNTIRLWDAGSLQHLHSFNGHMDSVHSVNTFENILVSADRSGEIRVFDIFTGDCFHVFHDFSVINSLQIYRRDGRIKILSMGHGNFLCEWDTVSHEFNCKNKFHFGTIRSSLIFLDWIFTAARDGAIGIWELERDDEHDIIPFKFKSNEADIRLDHIPCMSNDWQNVQKAFKEQKNVNLRLKDEIFVLKAEILKLKSNIPYDPKISESNNLIKCINSILDSHLKTASHQLVTSAVLLQEMQTLLESPPNKLELLEPHPHIVSHESESKILPHANEMSDCCAVSSIPVVLTDSNYSESASSCDSDICDELSIYYGCKSYQDEYYSVYMDHEECPTADNFKSDEITRSSLI